MANANQFNTQQEQQNSQVSGMLVPAYQSLINSPGYTPAQQAAITNASTGAASSAYGSAQDALARRAARTNNSAGAVSGMDQLAQEKANTLSQDAAQNQVTFANDQQKQQQAGLAGLSGVYGMDTSLLSKSLGLPVEYLQQYNSAAARPTATQQLLQTALAAGGQVGAAAVKGCWIAMAIYGPNDARTHLVRMWLNGSFVKSRSGRVVMRGYLRFGERIAAIVKCSRALHFVLKPLFDLALRRVIREAKPCLA
jgi:hypothetical protein